MTRDLCRLEQIAHLSNITHVDDARIGHWKMGDSFWPVREDTIQVVVSESSRAGRLREIHQAHKDWITSNSIVGSKPHRRRHLRSPLGFNQQGLTFDPQGTPWA